MVNVSKLNDNTVRFLFTENDRYLYNGKIDVPLNGLLLVIDESDIVTFKKPDGDAFIAFNYHNSNFQSKDEVETFYKENMTGGGGVDADEVKEIIASGTSYFDGAEYDSDTKRINFKHSGSTVGYVDATAFIKDGMVDSVTISGDSLVIVFNTDAGKEPISIPLSSFFDPTLYYTKTEIDNKLAVSSDTVHEGCAVEHYQQDEDEVYEIRSWEVPEGGINIIYETSLYDYYFFKFYNWEGDEYYFIYHLDWYGEGSSGHWLSGNAPDNITFVGSTKMYHDYKMKFNFNFTGEWMIDYMMNVRWSRNYSGDESFDWDSYSPIEAYDANVYSNEGVVQWTYTNVQEGVEQISEAVDKLFEKKIVDNGWVADTGIEFQKEPLFEAECMGGGGSTESFFIPFDTNYIGGKIIDGQRKISLTYEKTTGIEIGSRETYIYYQDYAVYFNDLEWSEIPLYDDYTLQNSAATITNNNGVIAINCQDGRTVTLTDYNGYWYGADLDRSYNYNSGSSEIVSAYRITKTGVGLNEAMDLMEGRIDEIDEVTARAIIDINQSLSGKMDTSAYTPVTVDQTLDSGSTNAIANSAVTNNTLSGGVETSNFFRSVRFRKNNGEVAFYKRFAAINGNSVMVDGTTSAPDFQLVETSAITTSITSASTDAQVPSAKAVYDALESGGGATYSAGTNISIDTGNTISCTIPFTDGGTKGFDIGKNLDNRSVLCSRLLIGNYIQGQGSGGLQGNSVGICFGDSVHRSKIYGSGLVGIGYEIALGTDAYNSVNDSVAIGNGATVKNSDAIAIGHNSIASGTTKTNINNQLKIDTDNQIYIKDKTNTEEICLQDYLGGGGLDDDTQQLIATALVDLHDTKADLQTVKDNYQKKGDYATKTEVALKANIADVETKEDANNKEQIISFSLNNLNSRIETLETQIADILATI